MGRRKYILIGSALLLIAVGLGVMWVIGTQPPQQPELECYEEQVQTMTIQEAANLLDRPLVELRWLPENRMVEPKITTFPSYFQNYPELSRCEINIAYPNLTTSSEPDFVSISYASLGYLEPTRMPVNCSWRFTTSGPTGSDCSLVVDGSSTTVRISIRFSPDFSPETILQILDGITVIEPSE